MGNTHIYTHVSQVLATPRLQNPSNYGGVTRARPAPGRARVVVNPALNASGAARDLLRGACGGAFRRNVFEQAAFSSAIKRDLANAYLRELPRDALLMPRPARAARARRAVTTSALCLSDVLDNGCVGPGHVHAAESLQNHRNPPATGTKMSARAPFSTDVHVYVSRGALDKAQAWAKARRLHHLLALIALLKLVAARSASARSVAAVYGTGGACSRVV